jgi:hypothetical protein
MDDASNLNLRRSPSSKLGEAAFLPPYLSQNTTSMMMGNRSGSNKEMRREPPKVFSDKVKEETEKMKK